MFGWKGIQLLWALAGIFLSSSLYAQGERPQGIPDQSNQSDPQQFRPGVRLFQRIDTDRNREVSRGEWEKFFAEADRDGDGLLNPGEFRDYMMSVVSRVGTPPERRQPPGDPRTNSALKRVGAAKNREDLPGPGALAPDFSLKLLSVSNPPDFVMPDREGLVTLSDHWGKKPVVLLFGSYT